jgi:tRNA (guanine-N7-)-methyltransferase
VLPRIAVPDGPLDPRTLFPSAREVWLEIGFGAGEHLAHQAARNPDIGLIGCEPYIAGVAACLARIVDAGLGNVRIHADDARALLPRLTPASLARIDLLFPDPWPKPRHRKRRLVDRANLDLIARCLAPGGLFRFATDDPDYAARTLALASRHGAFAWEAAGPADWRRPADAGPLSRCEAKAGSAGRPTVYLAFRRLP